MKSCFRCGQPAPDTFDATEIFEAWEGVNQIVASFRSRFDGMNEKLLWAAAVGPRGAHVRCALEWAIHEEGYATRYPVVPTRWDPTTAAKKRSYDGWYSRSVGFIDTCDMCEAPNIFYRGWGREPDPNRFCDGPVEVWVTEDHGECPGAERQVGRWRVLWKRLKALWEWIQEACR